MRNPLQAIVDEGYDCYDQSHHLTLERWLKIVEEYVEEEERRAIEAEIKILEKFIYHPTKPGYRRLDIVARIEELKQCLTTK